ncbi:MAG: SDR family NAD(P)-dependent oxidoreductase [Desulfobacterales bacterium]|nr:SDR family NAD(P)-dependent oxidoreductase [Desulfobacterales bacterium]MBF0395193.1 SDR family NAD(P)-dependent oxidoreductase [Desulfobacterales bacterium]
MPENLTRKDILRKIKNEEITAQEGLRLIKKFHEEQKKKSVPVDSKNINIAIIGISGRFPDASNLDEFWENLSCAKKSIREVPSYRWETKEIYYKWGAFLSDVYEFDPLFFGISPKEAEYMDPQQRLFLQEAWHAIEDAGYIPKDLDGKKCGVFVGYNFIDYPVVLQQSENPFETYSFTGNAAPILPARISYFLNLKGPSVAINTACSSSLVSIHMACESILSGTCEIAIAGGVQVMNTPQFHMMSAGIGMLSSDGRCKTFDNKADGFVPGEGVGVIVLKKLDYAIKDSDYIYGVIKGSGINQDGKTNGITAPSAPSQTDLECEVYGRYNISPETITYIEAHGTGTKLGDPIEIQALTDAFKKYTDKKQFCAIGAVKTNIGHTLAAAGVASVIKVLLCLKHKKLVPSLNFEKSNEHINFKDSPFYVNTQFCDWKKPSNSNRIAAVSAFGFSGTNAHIVIEEYENYKSDFIDDGNNLIVISAKNKERLNDYLKKIEVFFSNKYAKDIKISDFAYTLQVGRQAMDSRFAIVVSNTFDLLDKIKNIENFINDTHEIAKVWMSGKDIDFKSLYKEKRPRRIPIPTYPFAKETYLIQQNKEKVFQISKLHPFLDKNISTLKEQKFTTKLTGTEFYLKDHVIAGKKTFPGVAYIEMARGSAEISGEKPVTKITNVVWSQPINLLDKHKEIFIKLYPKGEKIEFEVFTDLGVNAQGRLEYEDRNIYEQIDIKEILGRCEKIGEKETIYNLFKNSGANYGKSFQAIDFLYANEKESLSQLSLPLCINDTFNDFVLHPSIMDGALQTAGFLIGKNNTESPYVPFSISEVIILKKISKECYAYAVNISDSKNIKKFNIYICDKSGQVLIKIKDFSVRLMEQHYSKRYFKIVWQKKDNENLKGEIEPPVIISDNTDYDTFLESVKDKKNIICLSSNENEKIFFFIFDLAKSILKDKTKFLYVYEEKDDEIKPQYRSLSALAKTLFLENSKLSLKTISLPSLKDAPSIVLQEFHINDSVEIRYKDGQRYIREIEEFEPSKDIKNLLKEEGVYLITGGASGIGLVFANYLASKIGAHVIICGRSPLNKTFDHNITYIQSDVSKRDDVFKLIYEIKEKFKSINGIIHSAGIIKDGYIQNKTKEEVEAVFAPKISGTIYLDEATKDENLDFFVLFSSISAITGNAGQSDYAYANSFMDNFADYRKIQNRHGKTISINWSLWKDGGMKVDSETEKLLFKRTGIKTISHKEGIETFLIALSEQYSQIMMIKGSFEKTTISNRTPVFLDSHFRGNDVIPAEVGIHFAGKLVDGYLTDGNAEGILAKVYKDLFKIISEILKIHEKDININEDISEYGFDSISFTKFANRLNEKYDLEITPVLFFEHKSIKDFSKFLCDSYLETLLKYYKIAKEIEVPKLTPRFNMQIKRFVENESVYPVAIIGVSCVMPKSPDLYSFFKNLEAGANMVSLIPKDRWDFEAIYGDPATNPNKTWAKWGGFMPDVDKFDCKFFSISPREAELMDPQQRLFLETVWKTIEDAGYSPKSLSGSKTGIFVGVAANDYAELISKSLDEIEPYTSTGMAHSVLANRISYILNFHGPSEPIDTACSSSLVAIHRAIEAIRSGSCDMAIAGGVNTILTPTLSIAFSRAGMLSKDGKCKTFDKDADGYVRGEGVGAIFLKPLHKAEEDGDYIYGVIRGTAENHGGHTASLTAPNPKAQAEVLISAFNKSGITPDQITYIEAHGTGTSLGDPIEISGLKMAFKGASKSNFCGLGSVKTNIGHLETSAGIAGVIKVLISMKYHKLFPNIHFKELNPYIDIKNTPFYIIKETMDWESPRIAGVSSFGFGGSNAHVVIEEYENQIPDFEDSESLILLSAKDSERLREYAINFLEFLKKDEEFSLKSISYTLQVGRDEMEERISIIVRSLDELKEKLNKYVNREKDIDNFYSGNVKKNKTEIILEGDEGKAFLNVILKKKDLDKIGKLWVSGVSIDWKILYSNELPKRVPLPTYPFARERYWYSGSGFKTENKGNINFLKPVWGKSKKIACEDYSDPIVFFDTDDKRVNSNGILVKPGKEFIKLSDNLYEINQDSEEDYKKLFLNIPNAKAIVHLWSLGKDGSLGNTIYSVYHIIKNIEACRFLFVSDDNSPFKDAVSGYSKSLALVLPNIKFSTLKVETDIDILNIIKKELTLNDNEVMYKNGERFTLNISNIKIEGKKTLPIKHEGVYLITGGAGGLGKIFADFLAKKYRAKIILTGRSKKEVEGDFLYFQTDVSDINGMSDVIKKTKEKFGRIDGVIHSAGISSKIPVTKKGFYDFEATLKPKVHGTIVLDEVTKNELLDFFVLFSSTSSILGDFGQCDYAVANRFLDGFAKMREELRIKGERQGVAVSINWHLWREGGLHMDMEAEEIYLKKSGMSYLETDQGTSSFEDILKSNYSQVMVTSIGHIPLDSRFRGNDVIPAKTGIHYSGKLVNAYSTKDMDILNIAASILKVSPKSIDPNENLGSFGFDSIALKMFAERLSQNYKTEITPSIFFAHSNIKSLCKYLNENDIETATDTYKEIASENEDIAVIGMDGIFPNSKNLMDFFRHLELEHDLITEIPKERWDLDYQSIYKWGGFISDVDKFDPSFFKISLAEAEMMDPQHRLFLQSVWKGVEDAGYKASDLSGKQIGIFVGVQFNDYQHILMFHNKSSALAATGTSNAMLANRVSYIMDWHGPSEVIDTACSSSLIAVHRAVSAIKNRECDMAVAGGVSLMLSPGTMISAGKLGVLSPDGRCKTFDKSANGYVKGEGVGVIVLKSLDRAKKDNDFIYATIKGSAVNHGGKAASLTAPNYDAQSALLISAYKKGGVDVETVSYLELHGTGTELGDPVEVEGIKKAFRLCKKEKFCGIGSVKTNIGHLEPASGIAGIMKVILSLQYGKLPGTLHLKTLNPNIKLENTPFYIVDKTKVWERLIDEKGNLIPRRAGISSFGFGGANCHVVLEEYENITENISSNPCLIIISAKNKDRLQDYAKEFIEFLDKKEISLENIAYTLQMGRNSMEHRIAMVVSSIDELKVKLEKYIKGKDYIENFYEGNIETSKLKAELLLEGEEGSEFIKIIFKDRKLNKLAHLWVVGVEIDWELLYQDKKPRRIPIPTYPFAKERHWIKESLKKEPKIENPDLDFFYKPSLKYYKSNSSDKKNILILSSQNFEIEKSKIEESDTIHYLDNDFDAESFEQKALTLFRIIKLIKNPIELKIITDNPFSLYGFSRAIENEYPKINVSFMDKKFRPYRLVFEKIKIPKAYKMPFKTNGVYLILGGTGNIGFKLSKYLGKEFKANLIWIGRRELNEDIDKKIKNVSELGGNVIYLTADANDFESIKYGVNKGKEKFGKIDGAIHAAIIPHANLIAEMDEETFRFVMSPKVKGSMVLYKAIEKENLDFLLFFSSSQSFIGDRGLSHYAFGCGFKDSFAMYLNQKLPYPVISINWGYWDNDNGEQKKLVQKMGFIPIKTEEGIDAICRILSHRVQHVMPLKAQKILLDRINIAKNSLIELYPETIPSFLSKVKNLFELPDIDAPLKSPFDDLNKLCGYYLVDIFKENKDLNVIPIYKRLYEKILEILKQSENCNVYEKKEEIINNYPEMLPYVRLLSVCMDNLCEILTGKRKSVEVIFPNSSTDLVESVYRENKSADFLNNMVAQTVKQYIEFRGFDKINILEIGAGTGGTSSFVLDLIKTNKDVNYIYTDISLSFLNYAKKTFKDYPFVKFELLNIEKDIKEQNYNYGSFDIVIAANVIHATKNIRNTLQNAKSLLKRNGVMILNEATSITNFTSLTFGLLEGWWMFDDEEDRLKGGPLLSLDMWKKILFEEGFNNVLCLNESIPNSLAHIITSESNGETRHKKTFLVKEKKKQINNRVNIEEKITESLTQVLKNQDFDINTPYTDFGVDSILAVEIINIINEKIGTNLRITDLFNYPTIQKLTEHITCQNSFVFEEGKDDLMLNVISRLKDGVINVDEAYNSIYLL